MPIPSLRKLLNWRLLALHQLAVFLLALGIHQFMLVRVADVAAAYSHGGLNEVQQLDFRGRWDSGGELMTYLGYVRFLPSMLAAVLGSLLSWFIVTRLRARRFIPVVVLLTNMLLTRVGLYRSAGVAELESWVRLPMKFLSLPSQFWAAAIFFTALGLLLFASTLLLPRQQVVAPTVAA